MAKAFAVFQERYPALSARVGSTLEVAPPRQHWAKGARDVRGVLERWVRGLSLREDMAIALSGVGDGSHVEALLESLPAGVHVFCAEPDPAAFAGFLDTELGGKLMQEPRLHWGVGEIDESFFAGMSEFPVLEVEGAQPVIFAPIFNENETYYSSFFLEFARQLDYWRKLWGTNFVSAGHWQSNTMKNLRALLAAPDVGDFKDLFKGMTMVVASAGPSLDESLEFIREAGSRAVIVAVNSSFRALRNAGIEPHFVLAADPNDSTDLGFAKVPLGRSLLVAPFLVYPKVVERFEGRAVAWSAGNALAGYLRSRLGFAKGAPVTEQGTVSACAFDLALHWGCSGILFLGQDLAAKADGQLHASDSFYADLGRNRMNVETCRWLPGNTLQKVPVEEKLYVYLKTFEQLARAHAGRLRLANASRLGARIEGVPYVALAEAGKFLENDSRSNPDEVWQEVESACAEERVSWEQVQAELNPLREYANGVCMLALRAVLSLEREEGEESGIGAAEQARVQLEEKLASLPSLRTLLESGRLRLELLEHRRFVRKKARSADADSQRETLISYLWAVAEGSFHFLRALESAEQGDGRDWNQPMNSAVREER